MNKDEHDKLSDYLLDAYVDGELGEEDIRLVEAHLQTHPQAQAYVDDARQQKAWMKQQFDPVLDEAVPEFLLQTVQEEQAPSRKGVSAYKVASFLLPLAFGAAFGWFLKPTENTQMAVADVPQRFVENAILAHVMYTAEKVHPVDVDAENERHLVAWISKRLGTDIKAPNLSTQGFKLVGGRLLPSVSGPSAQLMYEDNAHQRLTLYVNKNADRAETAFEYFHEQGVSSFYWVDRNLSYALTGQIDREQLLKLSRDVYHFYNADKAMSTGQASAQAASF